MILSLGCALRVAGCWLIKLISQGARRKAQDARRGDKMNTALEKLRHPFSPSHLFTFIPFHVLTKKQQPVGRTTFDLQTLDVFLN